MLKFKYTMILTSMFGKVFLSNFKSTQQPILQLLLHTGSITSLQQVLSISLGISNFKV